MNALFALIVGFPLLAGVFGFQDVPPTSPEEDSFKSVELGLAELSPRGEEGGYAVPASGSSAYVTCTLTLTPNPSTQGQNVALTWSNGQPTMNVYRNGVLISSLRSSGWTDTTASSLAVGSYVYLVQKDVTTTVCSGGRGGTCTDTITTYSCSRTLTVNTPPRPDLVPAAPAVVGSGATRTFTSTVTNSGTAAASVAFANRFEIDLAQNGSVDTTINANSPASLAIGATTNLTSVSSWAVSAGNHRVRTVVDTGSTVTESNEANNTSAWTNFTIAPDLTTSNVILNSGTLQVGTPVTFRGTVANSNVITSATGFNDQFSYRYGSSGAFTAFSTVAQAVLAAGGTANNTSGSITFVSSGAIQIQFCADSSSAVTESDETNNCVIQNFNVAGNSPVVTSCTASPNPSTTGQSVTWTANITGGTGPFTYQWTGTDSLSGTYGVNTVAKVYNSAGVKNATVVVTDSLAQSSGSYGCTALTVNNPSVPTVSLTISEAGSGSWGNSVTVDAGEDVWLEWTSSNADRCVGDAHFSTGGGQPTDGTQQTVSEPGSGSRVYTVTCYDDVNGTNNTDTATVNITPPTGDPTVAANPGRVQQGDPIDLDYDTNGNANCVITGTNGYNSGVLGSQTGTVTVSPINAETVFTISCDTGTPGTATARIFPVFEEI